jgi:hypothetical protein
MKRRSVYLIAFVAQPSRKVGIGWELYAPLIQAWLRPCKPRTSSSISHHAAEVGNLHRFRTGVSERIFLEIVGGPLQQIRSSQQQRCVSSSGRETSWLNSEGTVWTSHPPASANLTVAEARFLAFSRLFPRIEIFREIDVELC